MHGLKITYIDFSLFTAPYDGELIRAMQRQGHKVSLFCRPTRNENENNWLNGIQLYHVFTQGEQVKKTAAPLGRVVKGFELISAHRKLIKFVKNEKPDAVHFQWLNIPMIDMPFLKQLKKHTRLLLTLHDLHYLHGEGSKVFQYTGLRRALELFDEIIVHTNQSRTNALELGLEKDLVKVVPHGLMPLETPGYDPLGEGQKLGRLDPSKKVLLLFGAIRPYKGINFLLEAWSSLDEEVRKKGQLRILGTGVDDYMKELQALSFDESIVWIKKYFTNNELRAELENASCLVFPYTDIDSSGAFFTALAFNKPIIASDIGSFKETLSGSQADYLVRPRSVDDLKSAILDFLDGSSGPSRIERSGAMSWDEISRAMPSHYKAQNPSELR